jgi:hypothetical protein
MQSAYTILYCHMWPVRLCHCFPHYHINGIISGKTLVNTKYALLQSLQIFSKTFLILRRKQRDITINVHSSSSKVSVILVVF